jgi:catechol 2,3-dioxygenase-like lactoylglutathione lyase family enzyme
MLLGLNFVMLHVPDVEQARAFYTEKLGFVVEGQQPGFVQFKQNAGMCAIFALQEQAGVSPHQGVELWWLVDNADATYATLVSHSVETVSQPTDEPFGRAFTIKDPAGNIINMFQPPHNS